MDIVRGTILFDTPNALIQGIERFKEFAMGKPWKVVGFKNRFVCSHALTPHTAVQLQLKQYGGSRVSYVSLVRRN